MRTLAARVAVVLDEDEFGLLDIRDLQVLSARLCRAHDRPRGRAASVLAWVGARLMGRPAGTTRHPA